jgi:Transglutaminase-like superfamily
MSVSNRVARFRSVVRSPADLWLLARMLGWATALPVAKRRVPLIELVERAAPSRNDRPARNAELAVALARWVYRIPLFHDNCLEKSLLTFHYLPADERGYRLVLGYRGTGRVAPPGHAWLTVDGTPVHDTPQSLADLTPLVSFDETGRRLDPSGSERLASPGTPSGDEGGPEPDEQQERADHAGEPEAEGAAPGERDMRP